MRDPMRTSQARLRQNIEVVLASLGWAAGKFVPRLVGHRSRFLLRDSPDLCRHHTARWLVS